MHARNGDFTPEYFEAEADIFRAWSPETRRIRAEMGVHQRIGVLGPHMSKSLSSRWPRLVRRFKHWLGRCGRLY